MASRFEKRLILATLLDIKVDGQPKHKLEEKLGKHKNAEQLQVAYVGISRKVNGFKGKPATRVAKAVKAFVTAPSK